MSSRLGGSGPRNVEAGTSSLKEKGGIFGLRWGSIAFDRELRRARRIGRISDEEV
jgi:hypothetical protein